MKQQLNKHLRLATMVMGMTLATTVMADNNQKDSKANDLLCVTVDGGTTDALAVLRVDDNGQTQGLLCYLELDQVKPLDNCHVVAGRVYQATTGARNISAAGLIGTGLDEIHGLTQTNFAMQVPPNQTTGQGSAATVSVAENFSPLFDTQIGSVTLQTCALKKGEISLNPPTGMVGTKSISISVLNYIFIMKIIDSMNIKTHIGNYYFNHP